MGILDCRNLTKKYGADTALDNVNLELIPGRIVGLLGPNGSGKTTLIKLCMNLLKPTSGEILIDGMKPGPYTKSLVSYLPDRDILENWMNVLQLLDFYTDFYQDFDAGRAVNMLSSLGINERMPLRKMSKGTREKVQLIMTMSRRAKVYLLDEPIAGVDPAARDYILRTIISNYDPEAMVLISTHLIADVESVLDEAIFIRQGRVDLFDSCDSIRERTGLTLDEYFRRTYHFE